MPPKNWRKCRGESRKQRKAQKKQETPEGFQILGDKESEWLCKKGMTQRIKTEGVDALHYAVKAQQVNWQRTNRTEQQQKII
jgi:hypothetical protein